MQQTVFKQAWFLSMEETVIDRIAVPLAGIRKAELDGKGQSIHWRYLPKLEV
jgi:hypothetical protein